MQVRTFGDSDLKVTSIGLGLAALGRPGYINLDHAADLNQDYRVAVMETRAHDVLDAAWARGIRYFDAARSYGRAEHFLASWLNKRSIPTESITVGSKWGYTYTADWQVQADKHEIKEHRLPVLKRQLAESRAFLGEHLDLYQIHSATLDSGVLEDRAVLVKLAQMRDGGLAIGLTSSGLNQAETIRRAMEIQFDGWPLFSAVQATWNLLETSVGPVLREASEAGMGVIVKEALANGRLTPRNNDPSFRDKYELLAQVAVDSSASMDALALAAVLAQPWVDIALSGAATVEQLKSNASAENLSLDGESLERLQPLVEEPAIYWLKRSQLSWN